MDSLRRSFKSHGSHKHSSSRTFSSSDQEQQPILLKEPPDDGARRDVVVNVDGTRRDVVIKFDGTSRDVSDQPSSIPTTDMNNNSNNNSKVWRESSYEFWKEPGGGLGSRDGGGSGAGFSFPNQQRPMTEISEDPPSRLIGSFLRKQQASGVDMALDMDLEMEELKKSSSNGSKDRVSFPKHTADPPSRRSYRSLSSSEDDDGAGGGGPRRLKASPGPTASEPAADEVLRCTSNATFAPSSTLLRVKTRSRLMDPPPPAAAPPAAAAAEDDKKSGGLPPSGRLKSGQLKSGQLKSGILKSGLVGKSREAYEEDDEDPFVDEDIPDEFKRAKFDFLTILQWVSLILIIAALACSLSIPVLERQTVWSLHLWKWELLVLVLICGRLVSGWFIRIVVFFIERNFTLRKRVLYFVYGVRKAVQNCLWLGLVLVSWQYLLDKKVERETNTKMLPYVTKVLFCFLVACVFRLVKTLLVKVLASSFHVSTYFDRIQEALFNQYVIETLSGPPLVEIQNAQYEEDRMMAEVEKLQNAGATLPSELRAAAMPSKSGRVIGSGGSSHGRMRKSMQMGKSIRVSGPVSGKDAGRQQQEEGITIDQLHKLNQNNISAWNMKRLMRIVRNGTLTTLDEHAAQEGGMDESAIQIQSEYEAKAAAKKIFNNVAKRGEKYIYLEDLMRFMREDEAQKTMSFFEGAQEKQRVSRKSLKNWVINAFRERRALSLTLNDTKTAVNKLHQMANIIVGIIVFALWLLILGVATTHFFYLISSQVLLAVFVFGNTLKTVFEAIIFLFVMHPFDVGDRCEVDGVQLIVEEMNILTTIFLRYDNQKIIYPNSVLATKFIGNFYRSPDMGEAIDFCVHVATPVEKLAIMRERIIGYMVNKKEHWYDDPSVVLRDVDDMNRLRISIWMRQRMNFQDMGLRWARRELVLQELIRILRELDIEYRMLPFDVNVRGMPAVTSTRLPSSWSTFN
ncbi:mechanosensitive ion channel protein 6-like [Phoenix dactylifera]|uniref:Mechanosensitive ion channel protein n=1 Tax=Phoenix dactylifera TaxID=42345 RepID=A0A8B7BGL3_PHODC|nr:mechanosensitive ion channel protein 6-like [Phoenix dactylifera]